MNVTLNYTSGEYSVGTAIFSFTDSSRREQLGAGEGNRRISVRMYYPVLKENAEGRERALIISENKAKALSKAYHTGKMSENMKRADYYENVPVAEGKFPLIMFNHGYNSYIEANTFLCIDLASNGYIVASVGHAFEAVETDYEDGSFDLYDKRINKMMYTNMWKAVKAQGKLLKKELSPEEAYREFLDFQEKYVPYIKSRIPEWARDTLCALDEVKKRYGESIDFANGIGASGHSLGGAASYNLCVNESEFSCGINIDGALFGEYGGKKMERPFFQICCKENYNVETKPLLDTNAPVYYALFDNMKHMGFTDAKFFLPKFLSGKMDGQTMYKHLFGIHKRFFDKYLKNIETEFPKGNSDGVTYR